MMINIVEYIIPIVDISIIGTKEYLTKDRDDKYFLIIFLLNSLIDNNFKFRYNIINIVINKIIICQG